MVTYGGNSLIIDSSYESTANLSSSGGVVGVNQVVYTNTANHFKAVRFVGMFANIANLSGFVFLNMSLQRQGINQTNWFDIQQFRLDLTQNINNTEGLVKMFDSGGGALPGSPYEYHGFKDPINVNAAIILGINSRLIITSGTVANGTTFRLTMDVLKYYNS